ncbi:hypothetical protein [Marinobacter sp.]|uniref:DUF6901 family protein n=1 Tax=Marinobacter sp. TaxID=50741 RepID=UPI0035C77C91
MTKASVEYQFLFQDGVTWRYVVDADGCDSAPSLPNDIPHWAKLDFHQCSHCPLLPDDHSYCPYALALVEPVEQTSLRASHEAVVLEVSTRGRQIHAETTLQRAMGSLLGLIGPFSGCPVTAILRPMARFHLPLSNPDETLTRVFGTFLVGQYLRAQHGKVADWSMDGLQTIYRDLRVLNHAMSKRLRAGQKEDSGVNSFVLLDVLAADVGAVLEQYEGDLDENFREFLDRDL